MKSRAKGYIYEIYCSGNNRSYIGRTVQEKYFNRWYDHRGKLRRNSHYNVIMQNTFNKYGESSFSFHLLQECNYENIVSMEQSWLDALSKAGKGMNMRYQADGQNADTISEQGKKNIKKAVCESNKRRRGEGKGYYFNKSLNRWMARICKNGRTYAKFCHSEVEAIEAHKQLCIEHRRSE
jgi:group I intron endonuclease